MEHQYSNALLTEGQAAEHLGLSRKTLEGWRTRGGGPKFVRLGTRAVRYRPTDLDQFVEAGLRSSTATKPSGPRRNMSASAE
jgi:excisionase family DNA binding protein